MNNNLIKIGIFFLLSVSLSAAPSVAKPKIQRNRPALKRPNSQDALPAAAVSEGVFDWKKVIDYKMDDGPYKGQVAQIYGLRIKIEEDSAEEVKKILALPKKEMQAISKLPEKEQEKKMDEWYEKFYKKLPADQKLLNALYAQLENDSSIFYNSKYLCDPKCYERESETGFLTAFYISGSNPDKDPIIVVHGGPGGNAVGMLSMGAVFWPILRGDA